MLKDIFTVAHSNTVVGSGDGLGFDLQLFAGDSFDAEADFSAQTQDNTILGEAKDASAVSGSDVYDITSTLPEGMELDQARFDEFSSLAKQMGLDNENANKIAKFGFDYISDLNSAITEGFNQKIADWGQEAKSELGANFNGTVALAGNAIEVLERDIPGLRRALDETGAGNRVEIIRAIAALGELVAEDDGQRLLGGSVARGAQTLYRNTDFSKY